MKAPEIHFKKAILPSTGHVVVGVYEGKTLSEEASELNRLSGKIIEKTLEKAKSFEGKSGELLSIYHLAKTDLECVHLLGLGKKDAYKEVDVEKLGASLFKKLKALKINEVCIALNSFSVHDLCSFEMSALLASGMLLSAYTFERYKNKKEDDIALSLTLLSDNPVQGEESFERFKAVAEGAFTARDLGNEPANVLTPEAFKNRALELKALGVEVEVLDKEAMKALGMNALLGVAQGSINDPYLVVMRYNNAQSMKKPIAFVGKGVCFDTGGISIKPRTKMDEMKMDMGGAAVVMGTIQALARRKAKTHAVGVMGLVENMPSGTAQRPGDIVRAANGKTIEILDTDAEGRLVLADALWYAEEKLNPQLIIDLATLTGAVVVALGIEYTGLMSDDGTLVEQLIASGEATDEKVWRLPLHKNYDKTLDSEVADMKNLGSNGGGTITAAQFLKRFVHHTPWAHLDIAGTFMMPKSTELFPKGASGIGVRLLNHFVESFHEER
jgi:leucyl aminopeptidase